MTPHSKVGIGSGKAADGLLSWRFSALMTTLFAMLLQLSQSLLNPDWLSYKLIYEGAGAWLSEQGRDPGFLILTEFLANLFGPDGYESYRICFAFYFLIFVALLSSGRLFQLSRPNSGYLFWMVSLVYLGFTRFTIQIREGLAITLVVFSLALVCKNSRRRNLPFSKTNKLANSGSHIKGALFLLIVAALTHAATVTLLLIYLASLWVTKSEKIINSQPSPARTVAWRLTLIWLLAFLFAGLSIAQIYFGGTLERIATETVGDRFADVKSLSLLQLEFWGLYGAVCWLTYREIRVGLNEQQIVGTFASFLRILSGPAITTTYLSIVLALMLAITPLVTINYVRMLHMFLAIALLCLAVTGRRSWQMSVVGVLLIADQMRSIFNSITLLI